MARPGTRRDGPLREETQLENLAAPAAPARPRPAAAGARLPPPAASTARLTLPPRRRRDSILGDDMRGDSILERRHPRRFHTRRLHPGRRHPGRFHARRRFPPRRLRPRRLGTVRAAFPDYRRRNLHVPFAARRGIQPRSPSRGAEALPAPLVVGTSRRASRPAACCRLARPAANLPGVPILCHRPWSAFRSPPPVPSLRGAAAGSGIAEPPPAALHALGRPRCHRGRVARLTGAPPPLAALHRPRSPAARKRARRRAPGSAAAGR